MPAGPLYAPVSIENLLGTSGPRHPHNGLVQTLCSPSLFLEPPGAHGQTTRTPISHPSPRGSTSWWGHRGAQKVLSEMRGAGVWERGSLPASLSLRNLAGWKEPRHGVLTLGSKLLCPLRL